jgi:hypothetical protein
VLSGAILVPLGQTSLKVAVAVKQGAMGFECYLTVWTSPASVDTG